MKYKNVSQDVLERAKKIKLLLMDCDGVLTDGRLYYSKYGEELKAFHVHDGQGIVSWHKAGYQSGIITGRRSEILKQRSEELGIHFLRQGSKDKTKDFKEILELANVSTEEVAYIGDDIPDIELLKKVNLPITVKNCIDIIKEHALLKTSKNGGCGAVREVIDMLLYVKS